MNCKFSSFKSHELLSNDHTIPSFHSIGLWGLVNNAGKLKVGMIDWNSLDTFKSIADVNLWGMILVTQTFLPLVKKSRGRVVNMGSILGEAKLGFNGDTVDCVVGSLKGRKGAISLTREAAHPMRDPCAFSKSRPIRSLDMHRFSRYLGRHTTVVASYEPNNCCIGYLKVVSFRS